MRRRDFLKLASGAAVAGGVVAACSSPTTVPRKRKPTSTTESTTSTTRVSTTSVPPTTTLPRPVAATEGDWRQLASSLQGRLLRPSSPGYALGAQSYNPVFDSAHPDAIAYCASAADVALGVSFAERHGVAISIRSGGHCYGGWSTGSGLVIDVSPMNEVGYDPSSGLVSVGAGTRLIDLYAGLAPHAVAVPGGSCPSVGIAGLALGGGFGVLGRKFGLTCDNLRSADVVLASGDTVSCDADEHADLYWALRGGGGGSFGVVTRFSFLTHPIGALALFTLVWPWEKAAEVVTAWQDWAPVAPDELWSNCLLVASQSTPAGEAPAARVTGVYVGTQSGLQSLVDDFVSEVGASPFTDFVGSAGYLDTMMIEAGCENDTVAECHLPSENPAGLLARAPFVAKSNIVNSRLSPAAIATLLAAVEQRQASPVLEGGGFVLDAAGGAINRVGPAATAYVHRSSLATIQYSAGWGASAPPSVVAANRQWIESAWLSMRPFVSSGAYCNYADPDLPDWQHAYWGSNFARLTEVKRAYDPGNVFHFPQSVPPA
jgi:FAD/FMN-containing dehydrogenase